MAQFQCSLTTWRKTMLPICPAVFQRYCYLLMPCLNSIGKTICITLYQPFSILVLGTPCPACFWCFPLPTQPIQIITCQLGVRTKYKQFYFVFRRTPTATRDDMSLNRRLGRQRRDDLTPTVTVQTWMLIQVECSVWAKPGLFEKNPISYSCTTEGGVCFSRISLA